MTDSSNNKTGSNLLPSIVILALGIVAGIASGVLIDQFYGTFTVPEELLNAPGPPYSAEVEKGLAEETPLVHSRNTALCVGIAGGMIVGLLGLGIGIARRKPLASIVGLVAGFLLGSGAGVGGGFANAWVEQNAPGIELFQMATESVGEAVGDVAGFRRYATALLSHLAGWIPVVLSLGVIAGGKSVSQVVRHCGSGIGIAILASALYPFLTAIVFPTAKPEFHVPHGTEARILWTTLLAVCLAVSLIRSGIGAEVAESSPDGE